MTIEGEILNVLHGKNGRLFFGATKYFTAAGLLTGTSPFLNAWKFRIESLALALNRRGRPLYFLIAPEAHSVYSEDLPDDASKPERTLGECLFESIRELPNVRAVFPLQVLREAKGGVEIYSRNDTHWSAHGAYLAYRELCATLTGADVIEPVTEREITFELKPRFGNLGAAIEPEIQLDVPVPIFPQRWSVVESTRTHVRNGYLHVSCPMKQGCLLAARDSFLTEMGVFMHATFRETHTYGNDDSVYFDLVERLNPDWILLQRAESSFLVPPTPARPDGFNEIYGTDWTSAAGKLAAEVSTALDWGGARDGLDAFAPCELDPGHLFVRAKAGLAVNALDRALADAATLVDIDPHRAAYRILLARIHCAAQHLTDAIHHSEIAYEQAPENVYNTQTLIYSYLHVPDAEAATARFREVSTLIKDDGPLYYWASVARFWSGDREGAKHAIRHALLIEPGKPSYLQWAAQMGTSADNEKDPNLGTGAMVEELASPLC